MSRLLSWGESQMMTPNLEDLSVSPSVRHGHSIPGGLTDMVSQVQIPIAHSVPVAVSVPVSIKPIPAKAGFLTHCSCDIPYNKNLE